MNGQGVLVAALAAYLGYDWWRQRARRNPAAQLSLFGPGAKLRGDNRRKRRGPAQQKRQPSGPALVKWNQRGDGATSAHGRYRLEELPSGNFHVTYYPRKGQKRYIWTGDLRSSTGLVHAHARDMAELRSNRRRNPRRQAITPQLQIGMFGQGSQPSLGLGSAAAEADDPSESAAARADQMKIMGMKAERQRLKRDSLYTPDLDAMIARAEQRYRKKYGVAPAAPPKRRRRRKTGAHTGQLL